MATYPDNNFAGGEIPVDQYGGAPSSKIDSKAWTFLTGFVYAIAKVVLNYVVPLPYATGVAVVQESVAIGDVIAMDVSRDAVDGTTGQPIPWIGKFSTITTAGGVPKVQGIVTVAAAGGGKATFATGGMVPRAISGLPSATAGSMVAVDATTSRLRAWTVGDDGLGYASPAGNVSWFYAGRLAS